MSTLTLFNPFEGLVTKYRKDIFFKSRIDLTFSLLAISVPILLISTAVTFFLFYHNVNVEYEELITVLREEGSGRELIRGLRHTPPHVANLAVSKVLPNVLLSNLAGILVASILFYLYTGVIHRPIKRYLSLSKSFIANSSHEIRTPLAVIRAEVETAEKGKISEELRVSLLEEINRLEQLSSDILTVSKHQATEVSYSRSFSDIADLIDKVVQKYSNYALSRRVKLICTITNFESNINSADLVVAIGNILKNAIDFSLPNSEVHITSFSKKEVKIQDFGKGIAKESIENIFKPFYKSRTRENGKGFGLGLSIAKEICDKNGVQINVSSEQGNGSTFVLRFK